MSKRPAMIDLETFRANLRRHKNERHKSPNDQSQIEDDAVVYPSLSVAQPAVLGFFMTKSLMDCFEEGISRIYERFPTLTKMHIDCEPTDNNAVNRHIARQVEKIIEDAKKTYTCDYIFSNDRGLEIKFPRRVDFRMDLCEVFTIPQDDQRVQLRGQKGLQATKLIPIHTVLGFHRGLILQDNQLENNLLQNPRSRWNGTEAEWGREVCRYLTETELDVVHSVTRLKEKVTLLVSSFGYNAPSSFINDPRIIPENYAMDPYNRGDRMLLSTYKPRTVRVDNTTVQALKICGFPFLFVYTTKAIERGEELLCNYGAFHFKRPPMYG